MQRTPHERAQYLAGRAHLFCGCTDGTLAQHVPRSRTRTEPAHGRPLLIHLPRVFRSTTQFPHLCHGTPPLTRVPQSEAHPPLKPSATAAPRRPTQHRHCRVLVGAQWSDMKAFPPQTATDPQPAPIRPVGVVKECCDHGDWRHGDHVNGSSSTCLPPNCASPAIHFTMGPHLNIPSEVLATNPGCLGDV
jgi:hypothetical protein